MKDNFFSAIRDALKISPVWILMAQQDIVSRYRRTAIGPWWITLGTGIGLIGMAIVWSTLFNVGLRDIFPYITIGFTLWGFISSILVESSVIFVGAVTLKTIKIPLLTFVFFTVLRNIYTLFHTSVLIVLVLIGFQMECSMITLLFIPGLLLLILTALLVAVILGIVGARFRDLSYMIAAVLSFIMLLTPVMWNANMLTGNKIFLVYLNPIAYYLEVIRAPLLNQVPEPHFYYGILLIIVILFIVANYLYNRCAKRLIFWL